MIIGIGGVSRAGKTSLSEKLKEHFEKQKLSVNLFCQDNYVKPKISLPKVEGVPDWERPSTIKWESISRDVEKSTADIKIVEGLFSFYPASLRVTYDVKMFIDISKETFAARKKNDKRWEEEPDWYAEHVWRSYLKYGQPKGEKSDYITIDGQKKLDVKAILVQASIS